MLVNKSRHPEDPIVFLNGRFVRGSKAKISIFDHSFLYGDGVFEGIAVSKGGLVMLDQHIDRLYNSADYVRIKIPYSKDQFKDIITETIRRNRRFEPNYVRPLVSRGKGGLGIFLTPKITNPTVCVIPQRRETSPLVYTDGISLHISKVRRIPPESLNPNAKTNNYLNNIVALLEAREEGADDALLLDISGFLSEGSASNVFCVMKSKGKPIIWTPKTRNILPGIARGAVIEIAKSLGIILEERDIRPESLFLADEIFLTGSLSGIRPVRYVDGKPIGKKCPGEITKLMMLEYRKYCYSHLTKLSECQFMRTKLEKK